MGLCANDTKRRRAYKTIIIPRGIINPNEHNVIEIPLNLDTTSSLIVKAPTDANSSFSVEPYRGDLSMPSIRQMVPMSSGLAGTIIPQVASTVGVNCAPEPTTSRASCSQERPRRVDFSCQTQEGCQQKWSCAEQGTQSSFHPPEPAGIRQHLQVQDPHSPLCPICARASCKYLSNTGINRPYSSRLSQFSSNACQPDPYNTPTCSSTLPNVNATIRPAYVPNERNDVFSRARERMDNEAFSQMLDEKIEKILKPVLFSLGRLSPEDEDREKYVSSTCATKCSYSSIRPKYSREQCGPRKYQDEFKSAESYDIPQKFDVSDFEEFRRESRRKDTDFGTARIQFQSSNFDFNESKRRPMGVDRDPCPSAASCQRRGSVSFHDTGRNERSDLNAQSQESLLNKRINL